MIIVHKAKLICNAAGMVPPIRRLKRPCENFPQQVISKRKQSQEPCGQMALLTTGFFQLYAPQCAARRRQIGVGERLLASANHLKLFLPK